MVEEPNKATPAAYLPFKTFLSSIEALEHGLPKKLDRTVWRSQSGITQGQIMMALRFFRLIDNDDQPTHALHLLVEQSNKRAEIMGNLIATAYSTIVEHDLTKMSPKMLDDAMGAYNVQGDTRRKAVAFFLRAAKYAELPMHPLLAAQTRNSSGIRKKRKTKDAAGVPPPIPGAGGQSIAPNTRQVVLASGTVVTLTIAANWLDMTADERDYVFGLVDLLQKHPRANDESDEEEEDE